MSDDNKLYVLTYNEVQIAGYRIFKTYEEGLKEFIKHCILETKDLLSEDDEDDDDECEAEPEDDEAEEDEDEEEDEEEEEEYDAMSCVFEIQELQGSEYVTVREYDYDVFQSFIEDKEDILSYLNDVEKNIDELGQIPDELLKLFH
jgi:hypothetical protein